VARSPSKAVVPAMPELPEAETIARSLSSILPGKKILRVEILKPDVIDGLPSDFERALTGLSFAGTGRRGKNVVLGLEKDHRLVVNLGMTGRLLPSEHDPPSPHGNHPAVQFWFNGGGGLTYDDTRRFGRLSFRDHAAWKRWSATLGPEPLSASFTARRLAEALAQSRVPIRSWLLDQRRIAGVGNIYAVEALWVAEIHPARPANSLGGVDASKLHRALRRILRNAIQARGTTLRDYRTPDGEQGGFGPALRAYGREHQPCPRCKTAVVRVVLQGRSAFFCPRCQPHPHAA